MANQIEIQQTNNIQEKIIQFENQCVRTNTQLPELSKKLDELLFELTTQRQNNTNQHLITLYKLIAKTRDITEGKGEYALSYMMIWTWYKYFPELAMNALYLFVITTESNQEETTQKQKPYGSWKDIKYLCEYARQQGANINHPLIQYCITLINNEISHDDQIYNASPYEQNNNTQISLAAKWIARETSNKFGWLNEALATNYFYNYIVTAKTPESMQKAIRKCKTQYRQLITKLNRHIDTIQIKQAGGRWAEIDHAKTTSLTMKSQINALLNLAPNNSRKTNHSNSHSHSSQSNTTIIRSADQDRIECADNFKQYLFKHGFRNATNKDVEIKGNQNKTPTRYLPMEKVIKHYLGQN
jgi:hypothetical protein